MARKLPWHIQWAWGCRRGNPRGRPPAIHAYHGQRLTCTFFTRAFGEKCRETLPGRACLRFILHLYNGNCPIRTAFRADATANATLSDIDLSVGMPGDACPAAQHTNRILALPAGCSDADIAYHHTFTVHTRMSMPSLACLFALVAMNTFIQVNDQHFCSLHHPIFYQRVQSFLHMRIGRPSTG